MKKKIINIITRMNIGGATIHVIDLCHQLKNEYEIILVAGKIEPHESDMSYYADKHGISVHYLKNMSRELRFPADIMALWELYLFIKKEKPNIVHTHTAKAGTLGRLAAWLAGVPQIYHTFHGNIFRGYFSKFKTKVFVLIEKCLTRISTKIIAISEKQKQELADLGIARANKIDVIHLGFDFSHVLASEADRYKFRNTYNIPQDALCIAIIGRITAIKNHRLYLDIAEKLLNANHQLSTHFYFPIIGDGDLKEEIEKEILDRGICKNVFITGFIKDLKPIYADIDMTLITSHNEGTPVALIESMANGKIILSTNVGGVSDFVENGVNGFYFDEPNADLFVDKIFEIIEGKIDTKTMSNKANLVATKTFTIERLVKDMQSLYGL
jgi:glycosyltransferase involved in cell wall biosynthesis